MSLGRNGYVVEPNSDVRRELTVRAIENALGLRPPSFKVFRETSKHLCVPRFYAEDKFGKARRDIRPDPVNTSINFCGKLRDYQEEALSKYPGYGVLSLDTGLGKTTCGLAIASRMSVRTMIIVHKEFLANQWCERISQYCPGSTIGRVQQDRCELDHPFVIAMIQTLCTRSYPSGTFDSIGLVIVDEAHHVGAPAFSQAMFAMCPRYTLGLTATPDRKDGLTRLLYWFLGPCFFKLHRDSSKNVKVRRVAFMSPEFLQPPPVSKLGKVCLASMVNMLVEIPERNQLLVDLTTDLAINHHTLLLTDRRSHCEWLVEQFRDAGLYMGGMKQELLDESAKKRVVIGTFSLAHEGLDIPTLSAIVLATPHSDVRQAVGRILRTEGSKVIIDIVDGWSVMNAMYRKRVKIYTDAGFETEQEVASSFPKGKCLINLENA
jgi:superfamily II DNA or RNA helicase